MLETKAGYSRASALASVRLTPVKEFTGSLSNRTYLTLREAIMNIGYRPGEALRNADICAQLGVSRSPVANAILRLGSEGLVDVVPKSGSYVARFSMEDIREGAFLREAIELAAVEAAAPGVTEEQLAALRRNIRIQESHVDDRDFAGFHKLDAAMHELILSFTGFRGLARVANTAWVNVDRARQLLLPRPGRVTETLQEHRAILEAMEARDPVRARDAMRIHLRQLITFLEPLEKEHPEYFVQSEPPKGTE